MEQKIVLSSIIALLFNCYRLGNSLEHKALIENTLANIHVPDMVNDEDPRSAIVGLKTLIEKIINNEIDFDASVIKQQIDVYCCSDSSFLNTINTIITCCNETTEDTAIKQAVDAHCSIIHKFNKDYEVRRTLSSLSYRVNNEEVSTTAALTELREALNKHDKKSHNNEVESFIGRVTTDSPNALKEVFDETKKQLEGSVIKTGWKGINRMMGINEGMVPGECWVMPALPHNAKTLFTLAMMVSFALFNDCEQYLVDRWEDKKALLLDITLENDLSVNMPLVYSMVKEHFTGVKEDIKNIDPEFASSYVCEKLKVKGWTVAFERHDSTTFTVDTLREIVNKYEALGYRIVALRVDYLGVSNKQGLSNGAIGSEVRELYRRSRNITSPRKIALISPHQLSPAAKQLAAMNPDGYINQLPGKGLYDGCTTVDNEVDGEIYFGIVKKGDVSYFVSQRGKHRTIVDTPMAHRQGVMRFEDIGTLPWDLDKEDMYWLKSVNSDSLSSETDLFGGAF